MSDVVPSNGTVKIVKRAVRLTGASMECAPTNELGVVYLFAEKARSLGFQVSLIKPGFPDCIAYRRAGDHEHQVRIEFEFRSRSFASHGHDPHGCDCIVCWEHNWPDCPAHLEVIELRTLFGVPPSVWLQPAIKSQWF
ncbi:MAG: hypothetical protein SFV23_06545, partial [Planctomycetaceae bacterium]|nr:hypothetical protein [Planctomycetaceae bacterium]